MKKLLFFLFLAIFFFASNGVLANNDPYEDHPNGFKIDYISETSLNLKWDTNCSTNEKFYYKTEGSNQINQRVANCYEKPFSINRECQIVLNNLNPDTKYYFSTQCDNEAYNFNDHFFTLGTLNKSDIEISNISHNSVKISWQTSIASRSKIFYFPENNTFDQNNILKNINSVNHNHTLTNLTPNTKYKFKVTSSVYGGRGFISDYLYFTTLAELPTQKPDLVPSGISIRDGNNKLKILGRNPVAGEKFYISLSYKNIGEIKTNNTPFLINVYINDIFEKQLTAQNNDYLVDLGNSMGVDEMLELSLPAGLHTIKYVLDVDNQIEESNTNNNTYTTTINIKAQELPTKKADLVPMGISTYFASGLLMNRDPYENEDFYVLIHYKNQGNKKTNQQAFYVDTYLNNNFYQRIHVLNDDYFINLGDKISADKKIKMNLSAGSYQFKYILDIDNLIEESNINNNSYTTTINVKAREVLNEIDQINRRSEDLLHGRIDNLLYEINELRNQVREQQTQIRYLEGLTHELSRVSAEMRTAINTFITYGVDDNTRRLGEGERAAVVNSFKAAYGNLPNSEEELSDVIKIANGRWPSQVNIAAENRAKEEFRNIYKREANMDNPHDNAAVTIMAYGLRQKAENRNLNSEAAGLSTFRNIYGRLPQSTEDWNILQAITYSGATR